MKYLIYIFVIVLCFGCQNVERPKKPDNLISEGKMADIFYDVFILNSAKGINKKIIEANGVFPEDYVFEKYNIDSLQFALSNNYYAYNTKVYSSIMDEVKAKINAEKKVYEALKEAEFELERKEKRKRDSIKKIKDSLNKKNYNIEKIKAAREANKKPSKKTIFKTDKENKVKN